MRRLRTEVEEIITASEGLVAELELGPENLGECQAARATMEGYQPNIMMFGIYNAGKSTLVNALIGKKVAKVSDKPETSEIHTIKFEEYTLFDTPGLDAPIEHETITREHLEKCHVIVFVVSTSGAFELEATSQELKRVIESGRPTIIVMNNKSGLDQASGEMENVLQRFRENLLAADISPKLLDRTAFHIINAERALRGRLESNQLLVEKSGLLELETDILSTLAGTTGDKLVAPALEKIGTILEKMTAEIQEGHKEPEKKALGEMAEAARRAKLNMISSAESEIRLLQDKIADDFLTRLENVEDESKARAAIVEVQETYQKSIENIILKNLEAQTSKFEQELNVNIRKVGSLGDAVEGVKFGDSDFEDLFSKILPKNLGQHVALRKFVEFLGGPEGVKYITKLLFAAKAKLPSLFAGKGKAAITSMAKSSSKALGPIVIIAVGLSEALLSLIGQSREEKKKSEAFQRLHNACREMASEFVFESLQITISVAEDAFNEIESKFNDALVSALETEESHKAALVTLSQIKRRRDELHNFLISLRVGDASELL
ncbi:MAG: 50S ribosome-binding GTPase [Candidatus Sumerlaeia bacterium]|nr:50S ribosome-binding GTPase [Candidatus Sumerlaeia bacterium]